MERMKTFAGSAEDLAAEYAEALKRFKLLTMSVFASGYASASDLAFAVQVYEKAAECSVAANDLPKYVSYQSILLDDFYPKLWHVDPIAASRWTEFLGNFILYFSCFNYDTLEIAHGLVTMTKQQRMEEEEEGEAKFR